MTKKQRKRTHWLLAVSAVLLAALLFAPSALAFEDDPDGYLPEGETINDDLVISYGEVTIDGTVHGDVMASGNTITVNGTIDGNLLLNCDSATLNGTVGGSVAFIGQRLTLNSSVDGTIYFAGAELVLGEEALVKHNILFLGFNLKSFPGSVVQQDIRATGAQMQLGGTIKQNLDADLDAIEIDGIIEGNAEVDIQAPSLRAADPIWLNIWWRVANHNITAPEPIPSGMRIGPEAQINGELRYESPVEQAKAIQSTPGEGTTFIPAPLDVKPGQAGQRAGLM